MICVVVAHPDDESLWFGGTLSMFSDASLKIVIVCLTNGDNDVRSNEFRQACQKIGAVALMLDYPDGSSIELPDFTSYMEPLLRRETISVSDLTCGITHPPPGNER